MAFPSIPSGQTTTEGFSGAGPFEVAKMTSMTVGNILILAVVVDGSATITLDDFTEFTNLDEGTVSLVAGWRKITSSEPTSYTISHGGGNEIVSTLQYEVQGAVDPASTAPIAFNTTGGTGNPDPPDHTTGGGGDDHLFMALCGVDRRSITGFPSNMTAGSVEVSIGAGGANDVSCGGDTHQLNDDGTFNPANFVITGGTDGWCAYTIRFVPTNDKIVTPGAGSIVLTGQIPISLKAELGQPTAGTVAITGQIPALDISLDIPVGAGAVVLTGQTPVSSLGLFAFPANGSVILTGQTPVSKLDITINVPTAGGWGQGGWGEPAWGGEGSPKITGQIPIAQIGTTAIPGAGSIVIAGQVPVPLIAVLFQPGVGSIVLTGFAPSLGSVALPGAGSVVITGQAPISLKSELSQPGAGSIVLTGQVPGVNVNLIRAPGAGSIILAGQTPISLKAELPQINVGAIVITGFIPTVIEEGADDEVIVPDTGSVLLTGQVPISNVAVLSQPGAGSITITGQTPSLVILPAPG